MASNNLPERGSVLLVYVDDMIVTGNDLLGIDQLQDQLKKEFEIKAPGQLKYFLGIEVAHRDGELFLSQRKYIIDLLDYAGMQDCKPASTPIDAKHCIESSPNSEKVDKGQYQCLVGKLIYLSQPRPGILYAMGILSEFMYDPRMIHRQAAQRVLAYLKGMTGMGKLYKRQKSLPIQIYSDADYAGSVDDRRSTTGYGCFIGSNLVTWQSQQQKVVARSIAEAEFRAIALGICEGIWVRSILQNLGVIKETPILLCCDNKYAISIAHNPVQHDRTKHVEVDRHFIKEKLESGLLKTMWHHQVN